MKISFVLAAGIVLLTVCSPVLSDGQADVEARASELSQSLVKGHVAWKTKLSSPGVSLQAKESGRQGSLVMYNLYTSGLPSDQLYTALTWPVGQAKPSPLMEGLSIGEDGIVMCAGRTAEQCKGEGKDDPVDFTFNPAKGEPYRVALVALDYRAAIVVVPDPISAKNKGCTLSVERLLPRFELAYLTGTGFPANTEISFEGESHGEKHPIKTKTDDDGNLQFATMPFVSGHNKGTTTMKATGAGCSPSVKFDWGK